MFLSRPSPQPSRLRRPKAGAFRVRERGNTTPSPPYSGERAGVRGRPRGMLNFVANQVHYPWIAAETISPIEMHIDATTIASAMFFFSTISSHRL